MEKTATCLTFRGNCGEALKFYKDTFDGEIQTLETYENSGDKIPDSDKKKIRYSEFNANGVQFIASDVLNGHKDSASGASFDLEFNDEKKQENIFRRLADGGQVTMALQHTFWGFKIGRVIDKYGIKWTLICMNKRN